MATISGVEKMISCPANNLWVAINKGLKGFK
jgi:hypothetical protein